MTLKTFTIGLAASCFALVASAAGPQKPVFDGHKKHAATSDRHEAAVVVPAKKAYAWSTRDRGNVPTGIVEFNLNTPGSITSVHPLRYSAYAGCFANGKYYFDRYRTVDDSWEHIALSTVDLNTGAIADIADWSDEYFVINDMAYDYSTNQLYAMGRNIYIDDFLPSLVFEYSSLMTINLNTGVVREIKQYIDWGNGALTNPTYYTLACDLNGTLYSINQNGSLVTLDKDNDYEEVVIGDTGIRPYQATQSMEFDFTTGALYWAADFKNKVAQLYVLDTASGHASAIGETGTDSHLIGLYIPFTLPSQAAPGAPSEFVAAPDPSGALTAALSWKNPSKSFGGQNLATISSVKVMRNNVEIASLQGAPGQEMTYTDNAPETGLYSYSIVAANSAGAGLPSAITRWVGKDLPLAVSNLGIGRNDDGSAHLEWEEPTEGIHGGILDVASLGYKIVRFPDGVTVASDAKGNTFTDNTVPSTGRYYYTVESHTAQGVGELATSVEIALGSGISSYPWNTLFRDASEFNLWTVVNVNGGSTWSWKSRTAGGYTAMAMYAYDNKNTGDDYLISPNLYMQQGAKYKVRFAYAGSNTNYTEKLALTFGRGATAEAQSQVLKEFTIKTGEFSFFEIELPEISETGDYNIGFHALSDPGQYNIYITDVTVTQTQAAPDQPDPEFDFAAPKNLQATVNPDGSVLLTWDNSTVGPVGPATDNIYEDFDGMPDWEINPAGTYGWTYLDGDQGIPYVDDYLYMPYPTDGTPLAAMVMNPYQLGSYVYQPNPARSGEKYLLFKSNYSAGDGSRPAPVPDDWFISPELNFGQDFIFRFFCKADPDAESGDYYRWNKEQFRVGYSLTGNEPADFLWMTDNNETVVTQFDEWVKKEYSIPAAARYVCIHYCTPEDGYWFMVDDLFIGVENPVMNLRTAAAAPTFRHYEVHLDDAQIATTIESNHTLTLLEPGQHVAKVFSVYEEGRSEAAVASFNIAVSGVETPLASGIEIDGKRISFGAIAESASLYTLEGRLAAAAADTGSMDATCCPDGIYMLVVRSASGSFTSKVVLK